MAKDIVKLAIQNYENDKSELQDLLKKNYPFEKKHLKFAISWEEPEAAELILDSNKMCANKGDIFLAFTSVGTTYDNLLEKMLIVLIKGGAPTSYVLYLYMIDGCVNKMPLSIKIIVEKQLRVKQYWDKYWLNYICNYLNVINEVRVIINDYLL